MYMLKKLLMSAESTIAYVLRPLHSVPQTNNLVSYMLPQYIIIQ